MARPPRLVVPDLPLHVVQRGHNRDACFFRPDDYRYYLEALGTRAAEVGCRVHAYALMTNHVHLLFTPLHAESASRLLQAVGQRYVGYINRTYERTGTLWEGRFRSSVVDTDHYFIACQRYIELNPVRAGMVRSAHEYPWSSHRANAGGAPDGILSPHVAYLELGANGEARRRAYRALFGDELPSVTVERIRAGMQGSQTTGNDRFRAQLAARTGRLLEPSRRGRRPTRNIPDRV